MRDSNLNKIFHPFSKINLILIFTFILLMINCEHLDINYIENNDLYLILTKDGYFRAFDKIKKIEKWKLFFGDSFIPKNTNSHKLTNDVFYYPINDKFYILKKNEIISFKKFVKEIKDNSIVENDYTLNAKIENSFYLIDLKEGNMLEQSNKIDENSRRNINSNEISLKKVDYFLSSKDNINKKEINIKYSILSVEGNINLNNISKRNNIEIIHNLINYYELDKIISIYGYNFNSKIVSLLYDNSYFDKILDNNKEESASSNNFENKEKNEYSFLKIMNSNIFHIFIIIIITIGLIKYVPIFVINFNSTNIVNQTYNYNIFDDSTKNEIINNDNNNLNKKDENIEKEEKKINIDLTPKKEENLNYIKNYSNLNILPNNYFSLSIQNQKIPKSHSCTNLLPSGENNIKYYNSEEKCYNYNDYCNISLEGKEEEKEKLSKILEFEESNNVSEINKNCYFLQNFNPKNKKLVNQVVDLGEIKEYDEFNYLISLNIKTERILKFIVPKNEKNGVLNLCKALNYKNAKNKLLLPDINLKNKENEEIIEEPLSKKSTKEKSNNNNNSGKKIGNIWDDDDDEDESISNINNSKKEENSKMDVILEKKNFCEKISELNGSKSNERIKNNNKIKEIIKSRLDKDFKNLEKIGQGGFGIVLKGVHRLDKGICAIKIIKLKDINDKENIINEAITMTRLTSKHIVQYKTCWIDNYLGSAHKFFYEEDESESGSSSVTKSALLSKYENKKSINNNNINSDSDEEEDDDDKDNNLSLSRKNSNIVKNINNKNDNSQELNKNNRKIGLSKYCCNFRDDSHIATKSIISNKFINESRNESENLMNGEYFFILMEYCDGLTLEKYILENAGHVIDRKIIFSFTYQILKSLAKIHSSGIIHRDIKPCNIFIKNNQIKIGDFGLATRYSNTGKLLKSKKIEGTPLYLSPEQKNYKTYNEKVDIYACGITLYEMCSCFSTTMERYEHIMDLKNSQIVSKKVSEKYPEESILIKLMTKYDYNERPSAKDILESELFINLGKSLGYSKI